MPAATEQLLRYRPYRGPLRGPWAPPLAMARSALRMMARRKLFWVLYSLALLIFTFFFMGPYIIVWMRSLAEGPPVTSGPFTIKISDITKFLGKLHLDGSPHTYGNFIWFEGYIAGIALAFAGAVLVGNDFHFRSLPYYLSKPIRRWQYLAGKFLGVAVFTNLMTTLPALVLFAQASLLNDWQLYLSEEWGLFLGILGYGAVLTVVLGSVLVAAAVWLRRTVPLLMVWCGLFVLSRALGEFLVNGQQFDEHWKLIDLWNDAYLVGVWMLGADMEYVVSSSGQQPPVWSAALVLVGVVALCVGYLQFRLKAVEVVE